MAPTDFRADHIGSLLRPQYLLDAHGAAASLSQALHRTVHTDENAATKEEREAREAEKRAIKDVVEEQLNRGVTPITSGEFERPSFAAGFFEALEGIEIQFTDWASFRNNHPIIRPYLRMNVPGRQQPVAVGKVKWTKSAYMDDWLYIRSLVPEDRWKEIKMTIISPSWSQTQLKAAYTDEAYSDEASYLKDIAEAMRQEIMALYDAGCRLFQIDDPGLGFVCDTEYLETQQKEGMDVDALVDPSVEAHNAMLRDLPNDLDIQLHLCRGNIPKGELAAVGGYGSMATKLLADMHYKRFALEYDNSELTGDFEPLKHLPPDKVVVLGLVTTKDSELESMDDLKKQVYEAADIIAKAQNKSRDEALNNLAVSPSCGFASLETLHGTNVVDEVQWQKLELVKNLAIEIWGTA